MRWAIEIRKTSLGERNIRDLLDGLDFRYIELDGAAALTSGRFDEESSALAVFNIGTQLVRAFTGASSIDPEFQLGAVIETAVCPPTRHVFIQPMHLTHALGVGSALLVASPPANLDASSAIGWQMAQDEAAYQAKLETQRVKLEAVFHEERAEAVLRHLNNSAPSGEVIYKIYELLEENPSNRGTFQKEFGVSKHEFERFADAVHNPSVTGDWARHAYLKAPRSPDPMSRTEAEAFVRTLAATWLARKRKSKT